MYDKTIKKRTRAIRQLLNKKNIAALVVAKPANVTYITAFSGDDSWAVITPKAVYLLTDSRYTEQAEKQCPACRIIERTASLPKTVATLVAKLKSVLTIAVEKSMSIAQFEALKKSLKFSPKTASEIIEQVRDVKDSSELSAIRAAAKIASQALRQARRYMKPGVSESELAGRIDFQIRRLAATNSFETIVAFGANASRPHHQPGRTKLKKNDTVLIDFGAEYKGYCSDLTRCFAIGRPTAPYQKVYAAVQQAQLAAIETIKAGVAIKKVDAAARKVIAKHDLPVYGHGTGHGLGLEIHEKPFLNAENKGKLKAGQVVTIEPGVYIPGKLGVRIEDDILVTETGCEILSKI